MEATSGSEKQVASAEKKIKMPKIMIVEKTTNPITLTGLVEGTVRVNALENNGTMGKAYVQSAAASATEFGIASTNQLSLPTDPEATRFVVKFEREVESGVLIDNRANKYPSTIKLTLKCLGVEPCTPDVLRVIINY